MWKLVDADTEHIDSMAHWLQTSTDIDWNCNQLREQLTHPRYLLRVAVQENNEKSVSGFFLANFVMDECTLMIVAVDPSQRYQGLGKALIDDLVFQAKNRSAKVILLEVRQSNRLALKLYQGLGFCEQGRRENYYPPQPGKTKREAAIVMSLVPFNDQKID